MEKPIIIRKENPRICYYNVSALESSSNTIIEMFRDLSKDEANEKVEALKKKYVNNQYCEFHY